MSSLKACLKKAKEHIGKGEYKDALQSCKAALKVDKSSYEAYLWVFKSVLLYLWLSAATQLLDIAIFYALIIVHKVYYSGFG